jgi:hypothetical protein
MQACTLPERRAATAYCCFGVVIRFTHTHTARARVCRTRTTVSAARRSGASPTTASRPAPWTASTPPSRAPSADEGAAVAAAEAAGAAAAAVAAEDEAAAALDAAARARAAPGAAVAAVAAGAMPAAVPAEAAGAGTQSVPARLRASNRAARQKSESTMFGFKHCSSRWPLEMLYTRTSMTAPRKSADLAYVSAAPSFLGPASGFLSGLWRRLAARAGRAVHWRGGLGARPGAGGARVVCAGRLHVGDVLCGNDGRLQLSLPRHTIDQRGASAVGGDAPAGCRSSRGAPPASCRAPAPGSPARPRPLPAGAARCRRPVPDPDPPDPPQRPGQYRRASAVCEVWGAAPQVSRCRARAPSRATHTERVIAHVRKRRGGGRLRRKEHVDAAFKETRVVADLARTFRCVSALRSVPTPLPTHARASG